MRSAFIGSSLEARTAGIHVAARATSLRRIGTETKTEGSQLLTPYSELAISQLSFAEKGACMTRRRVSFFRFLNSALTGAEPLPDGGSQL